MFSRQLMAGMLSPHLLFYPLWSCLGTYQLTHLFGCCFFLIVSLRNVGDMKPGQRAAAVTGVSFAAAGTCLLVY